MSPLAGIHPVREALRAGRPLDYVMVAKGAGTPRIQEIIDLCREREIPVRFESRDRLDRAAGGAAHQGVIAFGAAEKYATLEDTATAKGGVNVAKGGVNVAKGGVNAAKGGVNAAKGATNMSGGGLHVVLDGVEDPHNLGAIIRTAHAAGAAAIVIPERRAAGLTGTVARAASGALAYLPVVRVVNVRHALEDLKKRGYWIYGLDERGEHAYDRVELIQPTAIVLGGEGRGLHEHVAKQCDFLVRIPMLSGSTSAGSASSGVASLNVSVAAGIFLFEWRRRIGQGR